jgi:hypothetical protein
MAEVTEVTEAVRTMGPLEGPADREGQSDITSADPVQPQFGVFPTDPFAGMFLNDIVHGVEPRPH